MQEQKIGAGEKSTGLSRGQFLKVMKSVAESELFIRITGETRVYDPDDSSVRDRVESVADEAIRRGYYTDTEGVQYKLNDDQQTFFELAIAYTTRLNDKKRK